MSEEALTLRISESIQTKWKERLGLQEARKIVKAKLAKAEAFSAVLARLIMLLETAIEEERKFSAETFETIMHSALCSCLGERYGFQVEWRRREDGSAIGARMLIVKDGVLLPLAEAASSVQNTVRAMASIVFILGSSFGTELVRRIFIVDEEFANYNESQMINVSKMLKDLCKKTGLQIICTSHSDCLARNADRTIWVSYVGGRSRIRYPT